MGSVPAIEVSGLAVRRGGRRVLNDISVAVEAARVTGLLGPSGCGKTTLMRAIVGVQVIERGSITVLGRPAGAPDLRPRVAYVTQAPSVYRDLTVRENLAYFAGILGIPQARIAEAIEAVSLGPHANDLVGDLSGGEQARASLATAVLGDPEVLVLDEPTVGLDPVLRAQLWQAFRELAAQGRTLLVSSHVMDEAGRCDRLLLMREGAILSATTPEDLLAITSASTLDEAFLSLIEGGEGAGS